MSDHDISYGTTNQPHPFHIVRPSIWPFAASMSAGLMAMGTVLYMHGFKLDNGFPIGLKGSILGLLAVITCAIFWWKEVTFEAVKEKIHTPIAQIGLRYGMLLFIASEIMFFVAFFWAFIGAALFPVGGVWPPANIQTVDPLDLPLLMTSILLLSGCTVTWAHHEMLSGNIKTAGRAIALTVGLGVIFLGFQMYEYSHVEFTIKDGKFPSAFFMATGFHGFHVLIGAIFLSVCYFRTIKGHFTKDSHFGFEAAAWYWHFVDVVWLFLFIAVYWWGGGSNHISHGII